MSQQRLTYFIAQTRKEVEAVLRLLDPHPAPVRWGLNTCRDCGVTVKGRRWYCESHRLYHFQIARRKATATYEQTPEGKAKRRVWLRQWRKQSIDTARAGGL